MRLKGVTFLAAFIFLLLGFSLTATACALNRRLITEDKSGSTVLSKFNYSQSAGPGLFSGHDKVGNVLRVVETYTRSELKNRIVTNSYDAVNRLHVEVLDESGAGGTVTTTTYGIDKANNRTSKLKVEGSTTVENLVYTYGNGSNASGGNSNQLTGYGPDGGAQTHTFTYDGNGNRLARTTAGRTDAYGYDLENRLVSLDHQTPAVAGQRGEYRYTYDHRTRRVIRDENSTSGGANTSISFSGGLSVQEFTGSTISRHYIRGSDWGGGVGGVLYSMDGGLIPLFDHYNSRGDVIGQTNASASVTWQAAYEAYGTKKEGGSSATRQKANTKDEDPHGLLNEGFRYRDLEAGVFITRDPLGFVDGPNVYTYVSQNPWTMFDPDGLWEENVHYAKWSKMAADESRNPFVRMAAIPMAIGEGLNPFRSDSNLRQGGREFQKNAAIARENLKSAPPVVRELEMNVQANQWHWPCQPICRNEIFDSFSAMKPLERVRRTGLPRAGYSRFHRCVCGIPASGRCS